MIPTVAIASCFAAVAVCFGLYFLRKSRLSIRLTFEVAALAGLTAILQSHAASPFLNLGRFISGNLSPWIQLTATLWWFIAAKVVASLVAAVLGHDERSREARLLSDLLAAGVYVLAGLGILNFVLDVPVKGLLATSGVVAVVIGLALQNTLSDVFSGIAVGVEAPFSVGDRISLGGDVEGTVVQINWRSTRIKTDGDDVAIIPNSRVARENIINRSVPTERRGATVQIPQSSAVAPEVVIDVLMQSALLTPGVLDIPAPAASLVRLGIERSMFALDFSVARPSDLDDAKSRLLLTIRRQLRRAAKGRNDWEDVYQPDERSSEQMLRETGLFAVLNDGQLGQLAEKLEFKTLSKDERLFAQGDIDPSLYIVAAGVIDIAVKNGATPAQSIGRIGVGDFVGEVCLLTGVEHPASATALTRCQVYRLPKEALDPLIESNPELMPAIEFAVRAALDQIHRGAAAEIAGRAAGVGPLLGRIYGFFQRLPG